VRLHPTLASLPNLAPPLFLLYLLAWLVVGLWLGNDSPWFQFISVPGVFYALLVLAERFAAAGQFGLRRALGATAYLPLTHILYGAGFWYGLFTRVRGPTERPKVEVRLERVAP
jgi:hypothetical protein